VVGVSVDASDARRFAADLTAATQRVVDQAPKVVERGALNIKNQMRDAMRSSAHFKGAARSISYDMRDGGFEAEIGPVTGPGGVPGDLAHLAYFGGSRGGGGTVEDPQAALDAEVPRFEKALLDLIGEV
jgi:hypothetical protein